MSYEKRILDEAGALATIQACSDDNLTTEFFLFPSEVKSMRNVVIAAVTKQPAVFQYVPLRPFKFDIEIILIALRDPEMLQYLPDPLMFDRALLQAIQQSRDPKLNKGTIHKELQMQQKDILKHHLKDLLGDENKTAKKEFIQRLLALNPNKELLGYSSSELLQFFLKPHALFDVLFMNAVNVAFFKSTHPEPRTEKPLQTALCQPSTGTGIS